MSDTSSEFNARIRADAAGVVPSVPLNDQIRSAAGRPPPFEGETAAETAARHARGERLLLEAVERRLAEERLAEEERTRPGRMAGLPGGDHATVIDDDRRVTFTDHLRYRLKRSRGDDPMPPPY